MNLRLPATITDAIVRRACVSASWSAFSIAALHSCGFRNWVLVWLRAPPRRQACANPARTSGLSMSRPLESRQDGYDADARVNAIARLVRRSSVSQVRCCGRLFRHARTDLARRGSGLSSRASSNTAMARSTVGSSDEHAEQPSPSVFYGRVNRLIYIDG